MKHLVAVCVTLLMTPFAHAGATLKDARKELQQGYYAEARATYELLVKDAKTRLPATFGLSKTLQSIGEYDKAQQVVETLLKDEPKNTDLIARVAELHYLHGRWEQAEKTADAALAINKDHYLARWVLGQIYRDRGETDKADEQFLWFIRTSQKVDLTDPDDLRIFGLAGLERARLHHLADEVQTVIDHYFRAKAIKDDKLYWEGEYEAGRVYLEKHNKPGAFRAFSAVMAINPLAPEVLVARGMMAASGMEFKEAETRALQALKINPRYVPALQLMSDVHWFSNETAESMKLLAKAQAINPREESTLARVAACHYAERKMTDFDAIVKTVIKNNPKCYTFYSELAGLLEQRKMNAEAERFYNIAIKMQPKFPEAQAGLGMLYMRMAKESEARKVLDLAADADPFNVRVYNSLLVLKHLDRYDAKETEHFIIRYDKKTDEVLANFMAIYLENIYKELADQFDYRPKGPYQIQIFNNHEMFAGRVIALPDLHTIGACTGPLVAMDSPKAKGLARMFNWNRVIRHELVHVFNLQQTKAQVPHWFTEGLAVRYEGPNIPPTWNTLLAEKFHADDLLNLDNILLGFIRPRSPLQWQQAYLQSLLYVQYLTQTHGENSIGKMLAAFQEGLDTGPALEKACGVKKADFEKGYRAFLAEKVKNLPVPAAKQEKTLKQLRAANEKTPDDIDIAAQLAEASFNVGKKREAKDLSEKVLAKEPRNPTAVYVKARLLLDEGKADQAASFLDGIARDDLKDSKPLKLLALLQYNSKKFPQAAVTLERARKIDPHDPHWTRELMKVYIQTKEKEKLLEIFEEVARTDPDELLPRKTLAKHNHDLGKHMEAEKYARMALEIDVTDRECQRIIVESLTALNRQEEADRLRKIFDL